MDLNRRVLFAGFLVDEQYILYEVYFQGHICDSFFPAYPPNQGYQSLESARERVKIEGKQRVKAYRIVECTRKVVEEVIYE